MTTVVDRAHMYECSDGGVGALERPLEPSAIHTVYNRLGRNLGCLEAFAISSRGEWTIDSCTLVRCVEEVAVVFLFTKVGLKKDPNNL